MKNLLIALALLLTATFAFAHAGHVHHLLGTVVSVSGDTVNVKTPDGRAAAFVVTAATVYKRGTADARRADMTPGTRVAVETTTDGKTAAVVKLPTR